MAWSLELTEIPCPFCDNDIIQCNYIPQTYGQRKGPWGGYKKSAIITRKDEYIVLSGCKSCGKTKEEIQKQVNQDMKEKYDISGFKGFGRWHKK